MNNTANVQAAIKFIKAFLGIEVLKNDLHLRVDGIITFKLKREVFDKAFKSLPGQVGMPSLKVDFFGIKEMNWDFTKTRYIRIHASDDLQHYVSLTDVDLITVH